MPFKPILIAVAGFLVTAGVAEAAKVRFRGPVEVDAPTAACDVPDGAKAFLRYEPGGFDGQNGPGSSIGLITATNAYGFKLQSGRLTSSFKSVSNMFIGSDYGPDGIPHKLRIVSQTPATISASTKTVNIVFELTGLDGLPDCSLKLKFKGQKQ